MNPLVPHAEFALPRRDHRGAALNPHHSGVGRPGGAGQCLIVRVTRYDLLAPVRRRAPRAGPAWPILLRLIVGVSAAAAMTVAGAETLAPRGSGSLLAQSSRSEVRVWRVGSPHAADTPNVAIAGRMLERAAALGVHLTVEVYPARGFAAVFADAVRRNAEPDVLTFDNFGVMEGITTPLGTFEGVGRDGAPPLNMVRVTTVFDDLVGPTRGWAYLLRSSRHFETARALALAAGRCTAGTPERLPAGALREAVTKAAMAYLIGDQVSLRAVADPERLETRSAKPSQMSVGAIETCALWGNERLAFVFAVATYEGIEVLGQAPLLLGLRRQSAEWRVVVAARDPVSTGEFMRQLAVLPLESGASASGFVLPASTLSPADGQFPTVPQGERFGAFRWQASPSNDVLVELAEFAYDDDARLVVVLPAAPDETRSMSAGALWTTSRTWRWRVWSIGRSGEVALSESRQFVH